VPAARVEGSPDAWGGAGARPAPGVPGAADDGEAHADISTQRTPMAANPRNVRKRE